MGVSHQGDGDDRTPVGRSARLSAEMRKGEYVIYWRKQLSLNISLANPFSLFQALLESHLLKDAYLEDLYRLSPMKLLLSEVKTNFTQFSLIHDCNQLQSFSTFAPQQAHSHLPAALNSAIPTLLAT